MMGLASFLIVLVGNAWKACRNKRDHDEYLKLHGSVTERVKRHIKPDVQANSP